MPGAALPKMPEAQPEKAPAQAPKKGPEKSVSPAQAKKGPMAPIKTEKKEPQVIKEDSSYKEDLLRTMQAKERLKERAKLKEVISIGKNVVKEESKKPAQSAGQQGSERGDPSLSLYAYDLREWVHKHYFFPDTKTQGIEAIINVLILADGTIVIKNVEKKSGNPLFDQAAIRAIQQSSPYKAPPREFEFALRFTP